MFSLITRYFPNLSKKQLDAFEQLGTLYAAWNEKINVISRKDIENLYLHHILHSLAIAKIISFAPTSRILDVGTGGGFPGIPLAIMFPESQFHLIDAIGKKITVVNEVSQALKLTNVKGEQIRVEQLKKKYHFIVSRAVTRFDKFQAIARKNIDTKQFNDLKNGIIYLKGGDFQDEIAGMEKKLTLYNISDYFGETFFETKKVIHLVI
ncbi:MAG: 16S rRNA (guanine(527)-N(7))-methyltransferase RsmG [Bacteroidetes bacterium HGW-Bacteroidetes-4]|jgi:16S rRNA (guanine527-N7)-methyltransferase|nr:MAG: 16S rRNA (guanine(527)-N(7))-methyltransferase RsmG [Bacteroidetes bacterium HGW-Bacteroidetes-4]